MAKSLLNNLKLTVANTASDSIKMIDIDNLIPSEDNFFEINRIEELAETILEQNGVKDNLIVKPLDDNKYEVISGHRRLSAINYLINKGEKISRVLPCLIQNYDDEDRKKLDIILMNVSARQISDAEMMKSFEVLNEILKNRKALGEKLGRTREKLAEILGVSPAQIGKIQHVEKYAVPKVKEAIKNGSISISTANEIAKCSDDEQVNILSSDEIKPKKIKDKAKKTAKQKTQIQEVDSNDNDSLDLNSIEKVDTNINIDTNKLFSEEISKLIDEQSDEQKKVLMIKIEEAVINTFGRDFFDTFLKKCCKDCYYFDEETKLWF